MTESRPQAAQPGDLPSDSTVPKVVVSRISLYLRELQRLEAAGQQTISSGQLGTLLGFSDAQVRKDLGFFGQFGYPGVGYRCDELIRAMRDILGTNQSWNVVMVGVGNLGQALLGYRASVGKTSRSWRLSTPTRRRWAKSSRGSRSSPLNNSRRRSARSMSAWA